MGKIAGLKNKSPETYPSAPIVSNVLQTLAKVGGMVSIGSGGLTSLLSAPIMFTPPVSAEALVLFSGVLQSASPSAASTNVEIILDGIPVYTYAVEVKIAGGPVAYGIAFDITGLSAGPHTIDVQAQATSGTSQAIDGSAVVIVTSA